VRLRSRSTPIAKFVRGVGSASKNVRPSNTKPAATGDVHVLEREKVPSLHNFRQVNDVALSISQVASYASFSRLSFAPKRISLPLSSIARVMMESCVVPCSSTTDVVKSCARISRPLATSERIDDVAERRIAAREFSPCSRRRRLPPVSCSQMSSRSSHIAWCENGGARNRQCGRRERTRTREMSSFNVEQRLFNVGALPARRRERAAADDHTNE